MKIRGWWSISGDSLMEMLVKVQNGEDPEMVYLEAYANSDVTNYGPSSEGGVEFP